MAEQPCYYCRTPHSPTSKHCPNCGNVLLLQHRYRLTKVLGRGGFGVVYEAVDLRLNRHCAVKQVSSSSLEEQQQIQNEVDILAHNASRFAFIPTIYDTWTEKQRTYIVMEYIDGPTLDQVSQPWSPEQVETFLRTLLDDLAQLHEMRIIHRDLKPQNIKYTPQGRSPYILLDFGISKQGGAHSIKALSPDYAPPEQAQGTPTDERSDLYSLAATAYHLLTGHSPLQARLRSEGRLPRPSTFAPATPPALEHVLLEMLKPYPEQRPQNAPAALALLDEAAQGAEPAAPASDAPPTSIIEHPVTTGSRMSEPAAPAPPPVSSPPPYIPPSPPASDGPPTQFWSQPAVATGAEPRPADGGSSNPRRSNTMRYAIVAAGVIAVVAIIAVGSVVMGQNGQNGLGGQGGADSTTATPDEDENGAVGATGEDEEETPTPEPTETPAPEPSPTTELAAPPPEPVRPARIAFVSERDGNREIYVMNTDGSEQTRLTYNEAEDMFPSWSPDGRLVLFDSDLDGTRDIYVIGADSSGFTQLTQGPAREMLAAWLPTGEQIAYNSDEADPETPGKIYVMDPDGSNQRLTEAPIEGGDPAWSPDGKRLAFVSDRDGNPEIYAANADGSEQVRLTNTVSPTINWGPAWSPDGTQIAFMSDREGNQEIFVMNADGSQQTNLTNQPDASDDYPTWSPDGQRIVFYSSRDYDLEIYSMNADGSDPVRLTNSPGFDGVPAWSP